MATPYPYRSQDVRAAAGRILARIASDNDGSLPPTLAALFRAANSREGLSCCAVRNRADFTAELVPDGYGEWTIFYNARHSERRRFGYLVHELAEWYAVTREPDLANLFDDLPGSRTYHYSGGDHPRDVRHRVARCAERLYLCLIAGQSSEYSSEL